MKPNRVGPKSIYLNPTDVAFTTAELAAIDVAYSNAISPYAHTATVPDNVNAINIHTDAGGANLAAGSRVAFGLFFSPQNDKSPGDFIWQLSGKASISASVASVGRLKTSYFFGRKATDNTVVSSKAAASNTLAKFMLLPSNFSAVNVDSAGDTGGICFQDSILHELYSQQLAGGFVYCFGFLIDNLDPSNVAGLRGSISLAARKYTSAIPTFGGEGQN